MAGGKARWKEVGGRMKAEQVVFKVSGGQIQLAGDRWQRTK